MRINVDHTTSATASLVQFDCALDLLYRGLRVVSQQRIDPISSRASAESSPRKTRSINTCPSAPGHRQQGAAKNISER